MTSSVFPFDFVCVRIPEDASAECEEVTFTATKPGDLTDIVKRCFAGGTVTNVEPLQAQYGVDAVAEKIDALNAVGAAGSVESVALVKPSKDTLPRPYSATFMYFDELGALKGKRPNMRALELATRCGLDVQSPLPGDVFVSRFQTEPAPMRPVDFGVAELDASSPWQVQAPKENAL